MYGLNTQLKLSKMVGKRWGRISKTKEVGLGREMGRGLKRETGENNKGTNFLTFAVHAFL